MEGGGPRHQQHDKAGVHDAAAAGHLILALIASTTAVYDCETPASWH